MVAKRKISVTRKMVDEEKRLRKQGTLTGKAASAVVGAGAGFTGAWEPLKRETGVKVRKQSPAYKVGWVAGHAVPVPMAHAAKGLKVAKTALRLKKYSKGTVSVARKVKPVGKTRALITKRIGKPIGRVYTKTMKLPWWRADSSIAGAGGYKKGAKGVIITSKVKVDKQKLLLLKKAKIAEQKMDMEHQLLRIDLAQAKKRIAELTDIEKIAKEIGKRAAAGRG